MDENTQPADQAAAVTATDSSAATTPATTTTSSIEKPTQLKAEYSEGAKLTWTASKTTDIDGYILFRSETTGKNYKKSGQTDKSTLIYTDKTAEAGKTYYYVARAYKGTGQSASSNEASLAIPANAAPTLPQNLQVDVYGGNFIKVGWDKNPEANIASYILIIKEGDEEVQNKTVGADVSSYNFKGLTPDTFYTITLKAINSDGKESEAVQISQKTLEAITLGTQNLGMSTLSWILIGIVIVLTGVLIVLDFKRRKLKKSKLLEKTS